MFYYIDQPRTPSFPIGLIKNGFDFIVESVETGLGRWMLVVPVISVDAYLFWFVRSNWGYRNKYFSGFTVPPVSKETKLGSNAQEASPSVGKNTGVVLVPCHAGKCVPTAISGDVDISNVLGCHL